MLPDLHIGFSRGRSGGLVFPSLSEFSTVYCDPHSLAIVNKAEIDVFLELSCFFDDPADDLNQIPNDYKVEVTNRFKGLELIDRLPEELWMEVRDIVQEAVIKTILKEKKCRKAKWLSVEALQIAMKRREVKGKGEKDRYNNLNAEFQRIARRNKKVFLSDQCKEIEENDRMGKSRDLFKKIRDTKGIFHAKMGSTKERNGMHLREAEDIKKKWQIYTEELSKNIFTTKIITMV